MAQDHNMEQAHILVGDLPVVLRKRILLML